MAADQPVERASSLEDIRTEVLTPDRLNAIVFGGFATLALLISVVGVAGVLAFSVSGRTREFGIRQALGAQPRSILTKVLSEGLVIAGVGVAAGFVVGFALERTIGKYIGRGAIAGSATVDCIGCGNPGCRSDRVSAAGCPRCQSRSVGSAAL